MMKFGNAIALVGFLSSPVVAEEVEQTREQRFSDFVSSMNSIPDEDEVDSFGQILMSTINLVDGCDMPPHFCEQAEELAYQNRGFLSDWFGLQAIGFLAAYEFTSESTSCVAERSGAPLFRSLDTGYGHITVMAEQNNPQDGCFLRYLGEY